MKQKTLFRLELRERPVCRRSRLGGQTFGEQSTLRCR
jgi:hypothetical protein